MTIPKTDTAVGRILTVDPSTRRVEIGLRDGSTLQVAVIDTGPFFRWPLEGETWMIKRRSYTWYLDTMTENRNTEPDVTGIEDLEAGHSKVYSEVIKTPSGKQLATLDDITGDATFELVTNKDTTTTLGTSDVKYPSQKAVKTYVDVAIAGAGGGPPSGAAGGVLGGTYPNPSFADADITTLAALSTTGLATRTGSGTWATRTVTGTASQIAITNGDGVSGNPTVAIDAAYVGQTSITTLGTVATGTWAATTIAVNHGGTGATTASVARTNLGVVPGTDVFTQRTITAPAAGITVTNGDGVSGNPTLALANDLSAVEGLSTNGMAARTGTSTWNTRTITGTTNRITVTNGDGVSGDPTLDVGSNVLLTSAIGATVQAWDADLDTIAAAGFSDFGGTSWTPTWVNVTVGTGATEQYDYWKLGKLVVARFYLNFGTSGALTGSPTISIPTTQVISATGIPSGFARASIGGTVYPLAMQYSTATTVGFRCQSYNPTSGTNPSYVTHATLSATIPAAWASGDVFSGIIIYRSST